MKSVLSLLLIPIIYIVLPYILGLYADELFGEKEVGLSIRIPFGFALMLCLFQILAVPMIVIGTSFSCLNLTYSLCILLLVILSILRYRKTFFARMQIIKNRNFNSIDKSVLILWILVIGMVIFQTWLLSCHTHMDTDDSRFVAEAMESYELNSLLRVHPINGSILSWPVGEMLKEVTSPFPIFIAVLSKLTLIHPAVTAHVILPIFLIPLCYLTVFGIGRFFLKDDTKSLLTFMLLFSVIVLFSFESIYAFGYTLLTIIWQGRSIMATIMLPFLWLILMKAYTENSKKSIFIPMLIASTACASLSGMGAMMSFLITFAYAFAILLSNKDLKKCILMASTGLPSMVYFIYYCFLSKGV